MQRTYGVSNQSIKNGDSFSMFMLTAGRSIVEEEAEEE